MSMSRKEYTTRWAQCIGCFLVLFLLTIGIASGSWAITLLWGGIALVLGGWLLWVKDWQWRRSHHKEEQR